MRQELNKGIDVLCKYILVKRTALIKCLEDPGYKEVKIPKSKKGEFRILHIPGENLKQVQRLILENIFYKLPVSGVAHCGIPKRSIKTNIEPHLRGRSFFKIDFKDAFPSVSRQMVRECLYSLIQQTFALSQEEVKNLAEILSYLTTHKNVLPQGAPTSPYLLNLVCLELDKELVGIALRFGLNYTRYADDLWFSSSEKKISKEARSEIIKAVQKYGFKINREKIKYKTGTATVAKITGVTLIPKECIPEAKTSIPRETLEEYRVKIHKATYDLQISVNKIFGIMGWVRMATGGEIPQRLKKVFRKFLEARCPEKLPDYISLLQ